jgi:hypothetical protein
MPTGADEAMAELEDDPELALALQMSMQEQDGGEGGGRKDVQVVKVGTTPSRTEGCD